MNKVITIDGPSASGKGTLAILLAERLNWKILDSGALYRAFAYFSISENDQKLIEQNLRKISFNIVDDSCLLYTSPSPRDKRQSRMPSSA